MPCAVSPEIKKQVNLNMHRNKWNILSSIFNTKHNVKLQKRTTRPGPEVTFFIHITNEHEIFPTNTLKPLCNSVHYNTVLDITPLKDGPQKCIDYTEK